MNTAGGDWRNLCKGALTKLQYIFSQSIFTDVCVRIIFHGKITEFKAHKVILQANSEVFEAMFSNAYKEGKTNTLEIKDVEPKIFELLLKHMHGQSIGLLNFEETWKLYTLADRYLIYDTKDFCLDYLMRNLNLEPGDCIKCFELSELYDHPDLRGKCLQMLREKTDEIVKNDSFLAANLSTIKVLLEQETLNVREIDLFHSVDSWIRSFSETEERVEEAEIRAIMSKISFLSMTAQEFQSGPANCKVLSWEEKYVILAKLTIPDCGIPMPEGFWSKKRNSKQEYSQKATNNLFAVRLTVNKTVQLDGINVYTRQDGSDSNEIEFSVQEENNDDVHCVERGRGILVEDPWMKFSSIPEANTQALKMWLQTPFDIVAGKSYILSIRAPGQRKKVNLDGVHIRDSRKAVISYSRYRLHSPYLPLARLIYHI